MQHAGKRPGATLRAARLGTLLAMALPAVGAQPVELTAADVAREFQQRLWTHEHGLPVGDRAWTIRQTRDGYLWVGNEAGLARFDGRSFKVYDRSNTPELQASQDCRTLAEDSEGNLWIGTMEDLLRKSGERFTSFRQRIPTKRYVNLAPCLAPAREGGVWVGWRSYWKDGRFLGSICRIRGETVQWFSEEVAPTTFPNHITCLAEDATGSVWIGSESGLARLDIRRGKFEPVEGPPVLKERVVANLWSDADGPRWLLAADYGFLPEAYPRTNWLAYLTPGRSPQAPEVREELRKPVAARLLEGDRDGALWLHLEAGHVSRYRDGRLETLPFLQRREKESALGLFCDREGNLWLGTSRSGLQCWTPRVFSAFTTAEGLAHDNVWSLCETRDGALLIGTDGGVTRFKDGRAETLKGPDGTAHRNVRAVAEDGDGNLWIGTMRTLECLRDGVSQPVEMPGQWFEAKIRALCPTRDGAMWVGTVRGLTRLHRGEVRKYTAADGLGSDEVRAILEDRAGALWVGTLGGGLSRLHDGQWTTLTTTHGLSSNNVWSLDEDADGVLWIGTDHGVSRLQNGQLSRFTQADGLPDNLVNFVISDDAGRLWVGHNRGVSTVERQQLDPARNRSTPVVVVNFDESDGLPARETNGQKSNPTARRTRDGRLWIPTTAGVAILNPSRVAPGRIAPLAAIEEVRANGQPASATTVSPLALAGANAGNDPAGVRFHFPPGGARILEVRFTANTFVAPEKARFRYRLVGLDDHWIDAGPRREAYFSNLRPGDYRFELMARNHRGVWSGQPVTASFQLAPFYYQTWWFYVVSGGGALALAGGAVRWRIGDLRRRHELERLSALNEQRRQIGRDIHDDLGASLTHIKHLSERAQQSRHPGEPELAAQRIASIAGEAVDHVGEIVWAINPEHDTLDDLVAYLREHAALFFAESDLALRLEFPETLPARQVSGLFRRNLVLILKEALRNVVRHAQARTVTVRLRLAGGTLEMTIRDDGRGLPAQGGRSSGNGLGNMRSRSAELNGEFVVTSGPGTGTEIRVAVPTDILRERSRPPD